MRDLFASRGAARRGDPRLERRRPRPAAPAGVGPVDAGRRAAARGGRRAARRRRLRRSGPRPGASSSSAGGSRPRRPSTCCTAPGRTDARPRRRPRSSAPATCSTPRGWPSARRCADIRTTAERAAADRTWTYGHVIVDEAQELSAMAWRLLLRRCPTRSMTRRRATSPRPARSAGATELGRGARPRTSAALAAGGADRQLPHAGRDHGGRRRGARRGRVVGVGRRSRCARPGSGPGRCG